MPDFLVTARTAVTVRDGDRIVPAAPGAVLRGIRPHPSHDAQIAAGAIRKLAPPPKPQATATPSSGEKGPEDAPTPRRRRTTTTTEEN